MIGHFSRPLAAATILLVGLSCCGQNRPKPSPTFSDSLGYMWESVEKDFISLADAMPEGKWDFKPTQGEFKDVRTFGEQVKHVACDNEAWAEKLRGEPPIPNCARGGSNPARTKRELMTYLRNSFSMMDEAIRATNAANAMQRLKGGYAGGNRLEVITAALWHASDHYGQLVVYLRMNGIVPPASRVSSVTPRRATGLISKNSPNAGNDPSQLLLPEATVRESTTPAHAARYSNPIHAILRTRHRAEAKARASAISSSVHGLETAQQESQLSLIASS